jgi:hypothetical protein
MMREPPTEEEIEMLKGSMRHSMGPGLLKPNGPLSSAENSMTHRSQVNRYPSSAPGSRPLDQIPVKITGTEMPDGLLSDRPLVGKGPTTASRG